MTPEIIIKDEFIVVGIRTVLGVNAESTGTLWKNEFIPRRKELADSEPVYYGVFDALPDAANPKGTGGPYEYVAGVASDLEHIPAGMVGWVIPGGSYAEAEATGLPGIARVCRELITEWLPDSGYRMADSPMFVRPHDPRVPGLPGRGVEGEHSGRDAGGTGKNEEMGDLKT